VQKNNKPVEIGDLVRCCHRNTPEYGKTGIVLDRIHYVEPLVVDGSHPDSYSCRVLFEEGERMYRARWLEVVSRKVKEDHKLKHEYKTDI